MSGRLLEMMQTELTTSMKRWGIILNFFEEMRYECNTKPTR
jgi:hypothetical protein